jgi:hypothetical protein
MKDQTENRKTLVVLTSNDAKWFHFNKLMQRAGTSTPFGEVVGKTFDLWFPVGGDLFTTVEAVLQRHGIAHNLTSLELMRGDYIATYNAKGE